MINLLLERITDHLPAREIKDEDRAYLERYYVGTVLGVCFYLHQFVASDPDRGKHDHPWPWAVSLILSGWYWEETRAGRVMRRWLNFLVGDTFHRVVLNDDGNGNPRPVWTLFAHRALRVKEWGFLREAPNGVGQVFVPHRPGADDKWWLTAPKGREMRPARAAAKAAA